KRNPHARHRRRRRIAAESSVGRESLTCVSRLAQLGQRMSDSPSILIVIDRETCEQSFHLVPYGSLDRGIFVGLLLREYVEHFRNELTDVSEFGDAEASCGASRGSEPNTGCHRRLLRVEWDSILVAGDVGAAKRCHCNLAREPLRTQV